MNKLILLLFSVFFGLTTRAQVKVTDFTEPQLKGHVKSVVEYTFRGTSDENADTASTSEKTVITFDERGFPLKEVVYLANGKINSQLLFEHLGDTVITKRQTSPYFKFVTVYTFKYDAGGKETEFDTDFQTDPSASMPKAIYRILYKYDANGNRIQANTNSTTKYVPNKTVMVSNQKGEIIQSTDYFPNGKFNEKNVYHYDALGNQVKSETYDLHGKMTGKSVYSYYKIDKYNNWLVGVFEFNGDKHVTKRFIEYY